eukprot:XP_011662326.1 PREDICTED: uncharacterized protein LOC105437436 [Strongylocentrotus purpuratus]
MCLLNTGFSDGIEVHTGNEGQAWYGASTTLSCSYTPTSSRNDFIHLLWTKDGQTILSTLDSGEDSLQREGRYSLSLDSTSSGNLTVNEVQIDDEGTYACQVKIRLSALKSSSVNLEVVAAPSELILRGQAGNTPVIIHQGTVTLKPGLDVEFVCEAIGSRPYVTITWYIDENLEETNTWTSTSNSNDPRLEDTTSSFVIANPGRLHHGILLTCRALMEGRLVRNTSIVINVEEPPDQPINILGVDDHVSSSTPRTPYCIAGSSFPANTACLRSSRSINTD